MCGQEVCVNPLNAKLNPICHLLALLGAHHILHISRIRVNQVIDVRQRPVKPKKVFKSACVVLTWVCNM